MFDKLRSIVLEVNSARDLRETLQTIVRGVRDALGTEVCSVYLVDPQSGHLVFMATEGLNKSLEGKVSLAPGEGLIGLVAAREETVNLDDAVSHPKFQIIAGLGEEPFKSFLAVPIIHHRIVRGVLVIQQREQRRFVEDEEAFLLTISAQLAGAIAHAGATGEFAEQTRSQTGRDVRFHGVSGAPGIGIGNAVVVTPQADLKSIPQRSCEDPGLELSHFQEAVARVREEIMRLRGELSSRVGPEELALFDAYRMLLDDRALTGEIVERINNGVWAQGALSQVILEHVHTFEMMEDQYIRDRATDLRDLGMRVLAQLQMGDVQGIRFPECTVLVGEEIPASILAEVPDGCLVGIVSQTGSANSHVAILARAMGVPTVMGVVDLPFTQVEEVKLVVDGYEGCVLTDPSPETLDQYQIILDEERLLRKELERFTDQPAETSDGHRVPLMLNTGLMSDVVRSIGRGAEGVGLYRTEVPFLLRQRFPTEEEQRQIYREHLEAFAPRVVTMRTLDVGGDKPLPYFPIREENPFLGWRGIRLTLDHPEIFLAQLRAMLKASEGLDNLRIMLPMVSAVSEVDQAIVLIDRAYLELEEEGHTIVKPSIGVMIEVPSAVYQAADLARRVAFLSVGSNDLTQYLLAVDRNNAQVADLYHSYHPAVLRAVYSVVQAGHLAGCEVSICGELAGDPGGALLLTAMGFDYLSMNATSLSRVKSVLKRFSLEETRALLREVLFLDRASEIRALVETRLRDQGISSRLLNPGV